MNPEDVTQLRKHPLQRFDVVLSSAPDRARYNTYEFIGQLEDMDVFWVPGRQLVLIKFSSEPGDAYSLPPDGIFMKSYATKRPVPSEETRELILAMCRCFAQEGRPPKWDEGMKEET